MYEKVFQGTKTCLPPFYPGQTSSFFYGFIYSKYWDACFALGQSGYWKGVNKVYKDGTVVQYGQSPYWSPIPVNNGSIAWRLDHLWYEADPFTGLPITTSLLNPIEMVDWYRAILIDKKNRLWIQWRSWPYGNGDAITVKNLDTDAFIVTIVHNKGTHDNVSWVRDGVLCIIHFSTGQVVFIDYLYTRSVIGLGHIEPCKWATYDCKNNVIVAIDPSDHTQVYVMEFWPYTLSNPTFVSTPVYSGQANTVKVRLTGQDGEVCPDWWIHWLLTGSTGYLQKTVSKTDANGYAENIFYGPADNSPGSNTIRTSVVLY